MESVWLVSTVYYVYYIKGIRRSDRMAAGYRSI